MTFSNPYPGRCGFYCLTVELLDIASLHPEEQRLVERFKAEKRKAEFITGRICAQRSLAQIGVKRFPVIQERHRIPVWPFSIAGSISHGANLAAALVCRPGSGVLGVGLDIEDLTREVKTNITRHVLTPREIETWLNGREEVTEDVKRIFSVKESIYKCFNPIKGIPLGFQDAEIDEISGGEFHARLLKSPLRRQIKLPLFIKGRVQEKEGILLSTLKIGVAELFENAYQ